MTHDLCWTRIGTPLGDLLVTASPTALCTAHFACDARVPRSFAPGVERATPLLREAEAWLQAYFAGQPQELRLPLAPDGTPLQRAVWELVRTIPAGTTRTYGALAGALGRPTACRAVAGAVARNPLCVLIPCHRVIGSSGALTGYAGGLARKEALLLLEARGPARRAA